MTLDEHIKNEIKSIENQRQNARAEWMCKDAHFAGRMEGLERARDLLEKEKTK